MLKGVPCTNCRDNHGQCVLARCRRGKKPPSWYSKAAPTGNSDIRLRQPPKDPSFGLANSGFPRPCNHASTDSLPSSNTADVLNSMVGLGDIPPKLGFLLSVQAPAVESQTVEKPTKELPGCFVPHPGHLDTRDLEYLRDKGAFCVPSVRLRLEIIRCYVQYMHPYMPLLDADKLLHILLSDATACPVAKYSLLLFQCVMFAGVAFVDETFVKEDGYDNLKAARKSFYLRTRLLYDADYESDSLTLVQSLLLMSLWCDNPDAHKQCWHWTGIAISLAQTMGLNRDPAPLQIKSERKTLRKRVWWSCFMRDRLISLGMSRPMRIRGDDFDTPLLTPEDFGPNGEVMSPMMDQERPVSSKSSHQHPGLSLTEIFLSNVKLCMIMGSIMSAQYSTLRKPSKAFLQSGGTTSLGGFAMLLPISGNAPDEAACERPSSTADLLDTMLAEWVGSLPPSAHLLRQLIDHPLGKSCLETNHSQNVDDTRADPPPSSIVVQCALVHMSYNTAVSALHRPRSHLPASNLRVAEAAAAIANICAQLNERALARYLPVNAITMLVPSIISNALALKSARLGDRRHQHIVTVAQDAERAKGALNEVLLCLCSLRQAYAGADVVLSFVDALFSSLGLTVVESPTNNALPPAQKRKRIEVSFRENLAESYPAAQIPLPRETSYMSSSSGNEAGSTNQDTLPYMGFNMFQEWVDSNTGGGMSVGAPAENAWYGASDLSSFGGNPRSYGIGPDDMGDIFDWSSFNLDWPLI
ncbi:Fungal specific transcription factor domain-containing protein [Cladophialophora immunda]|nr:Fungal specific transcription factor domain-containing protein [Cladophialophora immunda]